MPRVAVLNDIHGNSPALDAVFREVHSAGVDAVVIGGDVLPGPLPRETLARLRGYEGRIEFLCGNGERDVLTARQGRSLAHVPEAFRDVIRWCAEQLSDEEAAWIDAWPATIRMDIDGIGEVLFCHATPQNDSDIVTRLTSDDQLRRVFDGLGVAAVVCGHTHMAFDLRAGSTRVINAGSVGMPFGPAGAHWLLLGPDVTLRHTTYDVSEAASRIRSSAYPGAEDFANRYVLNPPSEEEMLAAFQGR